MPFRFFVYPSGFHHLMLQFDILHTSILLGYFLPILVDIGGLGVELGPFMVGLKCELVRMSGDVWPDVNAFSPISIEQQHLPQAQPGYRFSNQVPVISGFFS
jgi:hypothetical protein